MYLCTSAARSALLPFGDSVHRKRDVTRHGQPRHEGVGLKHQPAFRPRSGDGRALETDLPPVGQDQSRHQVDQVVLPEPENHDRQKLALGHRKGQVPQHRCIPVGFGNIVKLKNSHAITYCSKR